MTRDRSEYHKKWYKKNQERIKAHQKEYYEQNKEKVSTRHLHYQKENREEVYEYQRKWREEKRLKNLKLYTGILAPQTKRNHEQRFGGLREAVIQRDKEKCIDCGMTRKEHVEQFGKDITVDHINGKGRNNEEPENTMENLATRCLRCHGKKDQKRMTKETV